MPLTPEEEKRRRELLKKMNLKPKEAVQPQPSEGGIPFVQDDSYFINRLLPSEVDLVSATESFVEREMPESLPPEQQLEERDRLQDRARKIATAPATPGGEDAYYVEMLNNLISTQSLPVNQFPMAQQLLTDTERLAETAPEDPEEQSFAEAFAVQKVNPQLERYGWAGLAASLTPEYIRSAEQDKALREERARIFKFQMDKERLSGKEGIEQITEPVSEAARATGAAAGSGLAEGLEFVFADRLPDGRVVETPTGWLARVALNGPISALYGLGESVVTGEALEGDLSAVSERVKKGEAATGGVRDTLKAEVKFVVDNTPLTEEEGLGKFLTEAAPWVGGGIGFVADLLLPVVPGSGAASGAARSATAAKTVKGIAKKTGTKVNTFGEIVKGAARGLERELTPPLVAKRPQAFEELYSRVLREAGENKELVGQVESLLAEAGAKASSVLDPKTRGPEVDELDFLTPPRLSDDTIKSLRSIGIESTDPDILRQIIFNLPETARRALPRLANRKGVDPQDIEVLRKLAQSEEDIGRIKEIYEARIASEKAIDPDMLSPQLLREALGVIGDEVSYSFSKDRVVEELAKVLVEQAVSKKIFESSATFAGLRAPMAIPGYRKVGFYGYVPETEFENLKKIILDPEAPWAATKEALLELSRDGKGYIDLSSMDELKNAIKLRDNLDAIRRQTPLAPVQRKVLKDFLDKLDEAIVYRTGNEAFTKGSLGIFGDKVEELSAGVIKVNNGVVTRTRPFVVLRIKEGPLKGKTFAYYLSTGTGSKTTPPNSWVLFGGYAKRKRGGGYVIKPSDDVNSKLAQPEIRAYLDGQTEGLKLLAEKTNRPLSSIMENIIERRGGNIYEYSRETGDLTDATAALLNDHLEYHGADLLSNPDFFDDYSFLNKVGMEKPVMKEQDIRVDLTEESMKAVNDVVINSIANRAASVPGYKNIFDIDEIAQKISEAKPADLPSERATPQPGAWNKFVSGVDEANLVSKVLTPKEIRSGAVINSIRGFQKVWGNAKPLQPAADFIVGDVVQRWGNISEDFKSKFLIRRREIKSTAPKGISEAKIGQMAFADVILDGLPKTSGQQEDLMGTWLVYILGGEEKISELLESAASTKRLGTGLTSEQINRVAHYYLDRAIKGEEGFIENVIAEGLEAMADSKASLDVLDVLSATHRKLSGTNFLTDSVKDSLRVFGDSLKTVPADQTMDLINSLYLQRRQLEIFLDTFKKLSRERPNLLPGKEDLDTLAEIMHTRLKDVANRAPGVDFNEPPRVGAMARRADEAIISDTVNELEIPVSQTPGATVASRIAQKTPEWAAERERVIREMLKEVLVETWLNKSLADAMSRTAVGDGALDMVTVTRAKMPNLFFIWDQLPQEFKSLYYSNPGYFALTLSRVTSADAMFPQVRPYISFDPIGPATSFAVKRKIVEALAKPDPGIPVPSIVEQIDRLGAWLPQKQINSIRSKLKRSSETVQRKRLGDLSAEVVNAAAQRMIDVKPGKEALMTRGVRWLGNAMDAMGSWAKGSLLGGRFIANFRFLTVNNLTGPAIILGTLGPDAALRSLPSVVAARTDVENVLAYLNGGRTRGLTLPDQNKIIVNSMQGPLTVSDVAKIASEYGVTRTQTSFEVVENIQKEILSYSNTNLARMRKAGTISDNEINNLRAVLSQNIGGIYAPGGRQTNIFSNWANNTDLRFRLGVMIDSLRRGDAPDVAAKLGREALYDYGNLTNWERATLARAFWFWAFRRNNYLTFVKNMVTNPGRIKQAYLLKKGLDQPWEQDNPFATKDYINTRFFRFLVEDNETKQRYSVNGPPIPMLEAAADIADTMAIATLLFDDRWGSILEGEFGGTAKAGEELLQMGVGNLNPFITSGLGIATGTKIGFGEVRYEGRYINPKFMAYISSMPGAREKLFAFVDIEPVPFDQMRPDAGTWQGRQWRLKTQKDVRVFSFIQMAAMGVGIERNLRDYGPLIYQLRTSIGEEPFIGEVPPVSVGQGLMPAASASGLVTPIAEPTPEERRALIKMKRKRELEGKE